MLVEVPKAAVARPVTALMVCAFVFFLSCPACDFAMATPDEDYKHVMQPFGMDSRTGTGAADHQGGDGKPPAFPPFARHVRTRKWRTRISRRVCSADIEVAESLDAYTRAECVDLCLDHEPHCRAANFIGGDLSICELYHCVPTEFERDADDCQYIQVLELREQQTAESTKARTVIFMGGLSQPVDQVFLRGGISRTRGIDCTSDPETDLCSIDISVESLGDDPHYERYNAWRIGNNKLNWHGPQAAQGRYNDSSALGIPMVLTSSRQFMAGYQSDNVCGDRYWRVDLMMDCSQTDDGWFEVKGYTMNGVSEPEVRQTTPCNGTAGGRVPYANSSNHLARCGFVNVFQWGSDACSISHV